MRTLIVSVVPTIPGCCPLTMITLGDTADFVLKWDGQSGESFTHVSTGGGASLDLMAGKKLPGVERLLDAAR